MNYKILVLNGYSYKIYENGDIESPYGKVKPKNNGKGYMIIGTGLGVGLKKKNYYVHRLVAQAFIKNLENLPQVNHKDGNRSNNHVSNLEWVSALDNIRDYIKKGRANFPKKKPVHQYDCNFNFIKTWPSCKDAAMHLSCTKELIQQAANPNIEVCQSAKGFVWIYDKDLHLFPLSKHIKLKNKINNGRGKI